MSVETVKGKAARGEGSSAAMSYEEAQAKVDAAKSVNELKPIYHSLIGSSDKRARNLANAIGILVVAATAKPDSAGTFTVLVNGKPKTGVSAKYLLERLGKAESLAPILKTLIEGTRPYLVAEASAQSSGKKKLRLPTRPQSRPMPPPPAILKHKNPGGNMLAAISLHNATVSGAISEIKKGDDGAPEDGLSIKLQSADPFTDALVTAGDGGKGHGTLYLRSDAGWQRADEVAVWAMRESFARILSAQFTTKSLTADGPANEGFVSGLSQMLDRLGDPVPVPMPLPGEALKGKILAPISPLHNATVSGAISERFNSRILSPKR